jgi:phosphatidate cytidylyltransferase
MLKQRVITALILLAIILVVILVLPPSGFQAFVALCIALGAWEWSRLAGVESLPGRGAYTAVMLGLMYALLQAAPTSHSLLLRAGALWWLLALVFVCIYPRGTALWYRTARLLPLGFLVLLPGWTALIYLRSLEQYVFNILLLLLIVAAADIGAYFAGRAFGKHKLAPVVSPNKTWEGFIGGQVAACVVLWVAVATPQLQLTLAQVAVATGATLVLASASVVGDLFESMLKRQAGAKDSGTLLPGHGGVLDRIDSLTAALPIYSLLLQAGIL